MGICMRAHDPTSGLIVAALAALAAALGLAGCAEPDKAVGRDVAGDGAGGLEEAREPDCPGHWHASFDLYVNGTRISFDHPNFTLEESPRMPVATHMHRGNDWQWHFEPPGQDRCVGLAATVAVVGVVFDADELRLTWTHDEMGQAGWHEERDGAGLEARHRLDANETQPSPQWQAIEVADLVQHQPLRGERIILAFGTPQQMDWPAWQSVADARQLAPSSSMSA